MNRYSLSIDNRDGNHMKAISCVKNKTKNNIVKQLCPYTDNCLILTDMKIQIHLNYTIVYIDNCEYITDLHIQICHSGV